MRAELGTNTAMLANNRFILILIKKYRTNDASIHAASAADTFVRFQINTAALPFYQRSRGASVGTGSFITAGDTNLGYKLSLHAAACFDLDCTFGERVILSVDTCAGHHTGKASDTFIHTICF